MDEQIRDDMRNESEDEQAETAGGGAAGIVGAGLGAGAGLVLGPVGAVLGALAGAAGGWWAGKQTVDVLASFEETEDQHFRRVHERAPYATRPYDEVRHAYQLGVLAGRNPEYRGREFDTVEQDLQRAWDEARGHGESWDTVRAYVGEGFTYGRDDGDRA